MLSVVSRLRHLYGVRSLPYSVAFILGLVVILCLPIIVSGQCINGRCVNRPRSQSQVTRSVETQKQVTKARKGFFGGLFGSRRR